MRRLALVLGSLALVAAACGDSGSSPTTAAPAEDGTTTTAATGTMPAGGGGTDGGSSGEIAALLEVFAETPLRLTYMVGEEPNSIAVITAQDPTQDPPVTSIRTEGTLIITMGAETIFCDTAGDGECFAMEGIGGTDLLGSIVGPVIGGFLVDAGLEDVPGASVVRVDAAVAGRDGVCFEFTAPATGDFDSEFIRQCIDAELGFTLLIEADDGEGNVETIMKLTDWSEPTDEDFQPTGPVTETP